MATEDLKYLNDLGGRLIDYGATSYEVRREAALALFSLAAERRNLAELLSDIYTQALLPLELRSRAYSLLLRHFPNSVPPESIQETAGS